MPVLSHRMKLAYFDVPKVANTSIKWVIRQIEADARGAMPSPPVLERARRFVKARFGSDPKDAWKGIHHAPAFVTESFAAAKPVPDGYLTLAVVRDPILRLHSAWRDKINEAQFAGRGELQDVRNEGLPTDPTFGELIDDFERYRFVARPARVHTYGYAFHLGPDRDRFDHLIRIEDMRDVAELFSQRLGHPVEIPHENRGEAALRDDRLTAAQRQRLLRIVAGDYAWLGGLYDPERALAKLGLDSAG